MIDRLLTLLANFFRAGAWVLVGLFVLLVFAFLAYRMGGERWLLWLLGSVAFAVILWPLQDSWMKWDAKQRQSSKK